MHPVVRVTADWAALKNYPGYTRVFLKRTCPHAAAVLVSAAARPRPRPDRVSETFGFFPYPNVMASTSLPLLTDHPSSGEGRRQCSRFPVERLRRLSLALRPARSAHNAQCETPPPARAHQQAMHARPQGCARPNERAVRVVSGAGSSTRLRALRARAEELLDPAALGLLDAHTVQYRELRNASSGGFRNTSVKVAASRAEIAELVER
eukprot:SAG11_NODE_13454_length_654_cov_2.111712_1_plen_207_part_01